jgi:hypothetical protein
MLVDLLTCITADLFSDSRRPDEGGLGGKVALRDVAVVELPVRSDAPGGSF